MTSINEVAPPGFGHTKGDKEKGVKKGGTAAAFDKARKEGRFKGSKSDMFAIMWSQKNKGDKPHYKPGTNKKYKKYQEEEASYNQRDKELKKTKKAMDYRHKNIHKGGDDDVNEQSKFNAAKELVQHSDYMKPALQQKKNKKAQESFEIDKSAHKTAQKKAKMRNLARGNENPNEKAAAEKKAGGPKLMGEGKKWDSYKKAVATVLGKKKEKKAEKATDAGARAKRKLQRKVHAKYVSGSEDNVPDDMRD